MGTLIDRAMAELSALPPEDREAAAAWILEELEGERRWDALLSESHDTLREMARDARRERQRGETEPLDPDRL